ncbi:MAG TPA: hypothetical protein VJ483_01920 [Holophagaceae bacterium]|nr:hypothetical protein [Holophagaceae bacterium]
MPFPRRSLFAALLALLGCAPKPVPPESLAIPVLAMESHGPVVYADATALCTTTERGQDHFGGMELLDARGGRYCVATAIAKAHDRAWILDLAGNAPVHMALTLKPEGALTLAEAKRWIGAHISAHADYLDQLEGGRARALKELQAEPSLDAIFARFAGPWSFQSVLAETQRQADARAGVGPRPHPRP